MIKVGDEYRKRVPMRPFAKARPRVTAHGTYMPARYREARDELLSHWPDLPDFSDHLISISVIGIRPMPKSWSQKRRDALRGQWCSVGPDADNLVGGVMDALLDDDSCVVDQRGRKVWGDEATLDIEIKVLSDDPVPF